MRFYKIILIALFCFLLNNNSISQPHTEWVQRYNSPGNYNDYVTDIAIDKSGNVYLTGYTIKSTFDYDFLTIKYNNAGVFQWSKTYDGSAHEYDAPVGIDVDDSGYVYIAGTSKDSITNFDYLLIKYDKFGDTVYVRKYNHSIFDEASSMCLDKQGNIFISGSGMGCDTCIPGYLTVKFNSEGVYQWSRIYKGPTKSSDFVRDIIADSIGNLYVTGQVIGTMGTITIKYDQQGDTIWTRESLNGGNILKINLGNLFLMEALHRIIKYDLDGDLFWSINIEGVYYDILVNGSNSIFLPGVKSTGMSGSSAITKKLNLLGDSIWSNSFQVVSFSNNRVVSIAEDKNSNLFVTGHSDYNTPWNRFLTLSYDKSGNLLWSKDYNNNNPFLQHEAVKVKTDTSGNIFVAGISQGNGTGWDIALIKYSKLTGINKFSNIEPKEYKLYPNYPNPFNPLTNIKYEIPLLSDIEFLIINASGKEIFKLTNSNVPPGNYNFEFNGNDIPSGIYFLRFIANNKLIKTHKLILLK